MVAPSQTASLLWVQQAAVILPSNSRSLARQLSSRAVFHHYRSQRHAALVRQRVSHGGLNICRGIVVDGVPALRKCWLNVGPLVQSAVTTLLWAGDIFPPNLITQQKTIG